MIDNDVFTASGQSKDYEFYTQSQEEINQIASMGEEEWKIKWSTDSKQDDNSNFKSNPYSKQNNYNFCTI